MSEQAKSPWPGPKGLIPVTSGRADDANLYNRAYLDNIHVEMRIIDAVEADTTTQLFGKTFASPIMMPAFSHLNHVGKNGAKPMNQYAEAAKQLNLLNWVGMESDETFGDILSVGAPTVRIIKPFADHDEIFRQIQFAEENGALAVGMDIDHVVGTDGGYDVVDGMPLGPVMLSDLKQYASVTNLPFVAKGVLSVQDAKKAAEAGCAAVFVSHHHGRIPFGIAPAQILPDIKAALHDTGVGIFADCGVDSGYDAYKLLALGADAVSVGRTILKPLLSAGTDGVVKQVQKITQELKSLMLYTGVKDVHDFDPSVLYLG